MPTGPPQDISLSDTDPAMLTVSYRQPEGSLRNGDVNGYAIRYTRVGSGVPQMLLVNGSGMQTSVLPEIIVFSNYSVQVAAVNVNGTGKFSDALYGLSGQNSKEMH